jgi:hypothetical protein
MAGSIGKGLAPLYWQGALQVFDRYVIQRQTVQRNRQASSRRNGAWHRAATVAVIERVFQRGSGAAAK